MVCLSGRLRHCTSHTQCISGTCHGLTLDCLRRGSLQNCFWPGESPPTNWPVFSVSIHNLSFNISLFLCILTYSGQYGLAIIMGGVSKTQSSEMSVAVSAKHFCFSLYLTNFERFFLRNTKLHMLKAFFRNHSSGHFTIILLFQFYCSLLQTDPKFPFLAAWYPKVTNKTITASLERLRGSVPCLTCCKHSLRIPHLLLWQNTYAQATQWYTQDVHKW